MTLNLSAFNAFVVDCINIGVFTVDRDGVVRQWNHFMAVNSGVDASAVVGKNLFEVFPDLPRAWLKRKIEIIFELGNFGFISHKQRPYIFKFAHNRPMTGGICSMHQDATLLPIRGEKGEIEAVCFTLFDVTDTSLSQREIEDKAEKLTRVLDELAVRTHEMRLVLDNVGQGFLTLALDGSMSAERSAVLQTWLGASELQEPFWRYIARTDANAATWFEIGWESIVDAVLPLELALEQMPKRMKAAERTLEFCYKPIFQEETLHAILLILSDITSQVATERYETEQREMMVIFERILKDRTGFLEFLTEASDLVHLLTQTSHSSSEDGKRFVHTLKGNSSTFGLSRIAQLCHEIENRFEDTGGVVSEADRTTLADAWAFTKTRLDRLLDQRPELSVELDDAEYNAILHAVLEGSPRSEIAHRIASWKLEPAKKRLERIADQARAIARRLHKGDVHVQLQPNGLRFSQEHWAPFWSSFVHAVRNAIDHGLESPEERVQSGKSPIGQITLRTELVDEHVVVSIEDDGRGIDWGKLTELAQKRNLPYATRGDLINLLFATGVTTKDTTTEYSGRGVGMGAIRSVCHEMGGSVDIQTEPGRGTRLECRIPQGFLNPVKRCAERACQRDVGVDQGHRPLS